MHIQLNLKTPFILILAIAFCINTLNAISLKELDAQRLQIDQGSMQVNIKSINNHNKTTLKQYNILRKDNKNSLVVFMHKSEKGSLIVKENGNLFIKTGRSNRAIKISPIQRLVGDVSIGDILEIRFANNYIIQKQEKNIVYLKAISSKQTYAKVKIHLTKNNKLQKAELFSYSNKKLKTVFYEYANGSKKINKYIFKSLRGVSEAVIYNYQEKKLPSRLFKKRNISTLYQKSKKYFK